MYYDYGGYKPLAKYVSENPIRLLTFCERGWIFGIMAEMSTPAPVSDIEKARAEAKKKLAQANVEKEQISKKKDNPKDGRSDAQLSKDISSALRGIFEVIRYAAKFIGKRNIPALTQEEANEGAIYWLPLARRYYYLAQITLYIGAPIWLVTTLSGKWNSGEKISTPTKPQEKKAEKI